MEAAVGGVIVGVVVGMAASDLVDGIGRAFRPLVKEVIKGGIYVYDSVAGVVSETSEHFSDLVAEARAELEAKGSGDGAKGKGHGK